jgi:putative flippase GtrA
MKALIQRFCTGELFRFIVVGGLSAAIEYSLYFLFKPLFGYMAGFGYMAANVVAFACTNVFTYILTRRYVFGSTNENKRQEALLFFLCLSGALIANSITLWMLVKLAGTDHRIAKIIAIAVAVVWNFYTRKHVVFKNREVAAEAAPPPPTKGFREDRI